jgi:alpha-beta hydrolase superfamily lysophospholipase
VPTPELTWDAEPDHPAGVVLVLHGGKSRSRTATSPWQPAVWWMRPFADAVVDAGQGRVAVARLRYAVRGWNGADASPLVDAHNALEQVAAGHPGVPIGLLGHSMGGRVALHLADDERVRAVAALAPWVERPDTAHTHPGLRGPRHLGEGVPNDGRRHGGAARRRDLRVGRRGNALHAAPLPPVA